METTKLFEGGIAIDDRGDLTFVNGFSFDGVKRFYQIQNHNPMFIRAWHGHKREAKYIYVAQGIALIGVTPIDGYSDLNKPERYVLSYKKPSVLYIPEGHFNGIMTFTMDTIVQVFSTSTLEESLGDDIRLPYDFWDVWDIERR